MNFISASYNMYHNSIDIYCNMFDFHNNTLAAELKNSAAFDMRYSIRYLYGVDCMVDLKQRKQSDFRVSLAKQALHKYRDGGTDKSGFRTKDFRGIFQKLQVSYPVHLQELGRKRCKITGGFCERAIGD